MTDTLILLASIGTMNILCFFIGAKVGQKVVKGETIEFPKIEPIKAIREHNEKSEILKLQEKDYFRHLPLYLRLVEIFPV